MFSHNWMLNADAVRIAAQTTSITPSSIQSMLVGKMLSELYI